MTNSTDRIGKFEIIERLGTGSLGEAFLARDTIIGREVAIKIIRKAALAGPDPEGRFLRESQAASRLNHPNVVTIHEFGDKAGRLFQVMDYVAGADLGTLFRDHALTPSESLELLAQVCDGLAYAHQHGTPHRNLKPSNIRMGRMAGRPAPKLLDFGLTKGLASDPEHAASLLETLARTAPEALQGKADARSDLFSVGALLHEALTGSAPFAGATAAEITQRVREEQPAALDLQLYPELSPAIQDILRQALAKDPAQRFASAEAMAATLRAARNPDWVPQVEPPEAIKTARLVPKAQPREGSRSSSKGLLAWSCVLAALLVLGGAGGFWLRARRKTQRPAEVAALPVPVPPPVAVPAPVAPPPAPEPAPAVPVKPAFATVEDAAGALEKDPQGALAFLDQTVAADPANERAYALRIVALYNLARYGASAKAIREAREAGHPLWPMALKNPALRAMLEKDARDPHLPKRKAPAPVPAPAPES